MRLDVITTLVAILSVASGEVATATVDPAAVTPPTTTKSNDAGEDKNDVNQQILQNMQDMMKIVAQQQQDMAAMQKLMADDKAVMQKIMADAHQINGPIQNNGDNSKENKEETEEEKERRREMGKKNRFASFHYPEKRNFKGLDKDAHVRLAPWRYIDPDILEEELGI